MTDERRESLMEDNELTRFEVTLLKEKIFTSSNKGLISGIIDSELEYSHEAFEQKFYRTKVRVKRFSDTEDIIPIMISDANGKTEILNKLIKGKRVKLAGQLRTINKWEENISKLEVFLFVKFIEIYEEEAEKEETEDVDLIYLDGYICKKPIYRKTPLEKEITELNIAVDRAHNKSAYIPCITWGKTAKRAKSLEIGDRVELLGRLQSRWYFKKYSPDSKEGEWKVTYEISIIKMRKISKTNN